MAKMDDDHRVFLGPRLFTRRQILKGFGGGAATLGLGLLKACEGCKPNPGEETTLIEPTQETTGETTTGGGIQDPQTVVREDMGEKAATYFDAQVRDPNIIDYIDRRAALFGEACNLGGSEDGLELKILTEDPLPILDIGGEFTNDQSFLAIVDLDRSPAFVKYFSRETGRGAKNDTLSACFVTNRFFDPRVSTANEQPVVGIVDAVIVCATKPIEGNELLSVEFYLVDCGGVELLHKMEVDSTQHPSDHPIDQNPNTVGRNQRINAYFGYLVASYNGQKVLLPYDPFDFDDPLPSSGERRESFAGLQGVQYQRVDPNVPPEDFGEPSDQNDTGGFGNYEQIWKANPATSPGEGLEVHGYPLEITEDGPQPPDPPPTGWGPPQGWSDFTCFKFETRDACQGCCGDKALGGYASVGLAYGICVATTAGTTCWVVPIIGNISCLFACTVAAAAVVVAVRGMETNCKANCMIPTRLD